MKHLLLLFCFLLTGCSKINTVAVNTLSQAEEKFITICQEEYNFTPVVFRLPNTMWIYIPLAQNIFEFKASDKGPSSSAEASKSFAIHYLDGKFKDSQFVIQYDIGPVKKYAKDPGYSSSYTEEFQTKQRGILTAVYRAYGGLPADRESPEKAPDFFVLVMADIKTGLETTTLFYFPDFRRAMSDNFFYEEFTRRTISEEPTGHTNILGDTTGRHLDPQEINFPEFLAKQIVFRIRYKFQRSDFPPEGQIADEIAAIVQETVGNYGFKDFDGVRLENLLSGETVSIKNQRQ